MAAVLCQGLGKACGTCCDCIGSVVLLPCKACGWCCNKFGMSCVECCAAIGTCCSTAFGCYVTTAVALSVPSILVGFLDLAKSVPAGGFGCSGNWWLLVHWLLSLLNIVAAFYMNWAVQKPDSDILPPTANTNDAPPYQPQQSSTSSGLGRVKNLFCFDLWMAGYILFASGYVVWLCVGVVWYSTGKMGLGCSSDATTAVYIPVAFAFGWSFLFLGGTALLMSLCCTAWRGPSTRHAPPPPTSTSVSQQSTTKYPAANPTPSSKLSPAAAAGTTTTTAHPTPSAPEKPPPMASATPVLNAGDDDDNLPTATATPIYSAVTGDDQNYGSCNNKNNST